MHWRDDPQAIVDEATLELYYTGRDNGNTLTLARTGFWPNGSTAR